MLETRTRSPRPEASVACRTTATSAAPSEGPTKMRSTSWSTSNETLMPSAGTTTPNSSAVRRETARRNSRSQENAMCLYQKRWSILTLSRSLRRSTYLTLPAHRSSTPYSGLRRKGFAAAAIRRGVVRIATPFHAPAYSCHIASLSYGARCQQLIFVNRRNSSNALSPCSRSVYLGSTGKPGGNTATAPSNGS